MSMPNKLLEVEVIVSESVRSNKLEYLSPFDIALNIGLS
jgi:hypothetical protein